MIKLVIMLSLSKPLFLGLGIFPSIIYLNRLCKTPAAKGMRKKREREKQAAGYKL